MLWLQARARCQRLCLILVVRHQRAHTNMKATYMKSPSGDDRQNGSSCSSKFHMFYKKHPRFPLPLLFVIGMLVMISIIISKFFAGSH